MVITGPPRSLEGLLSTVEGWVHFRVFLSSPLNSTQSQTNPKYHLFLHGPSSFKFYRSLGGEYSLGYSSMSAVKNELHKIENTPMDKKKVLPLSKL